MSKIISAIVALLWFGGSFALLVMKVFGVCDYSWWLATIGFWAPMSFVVSVVALVSAILYMAHLVRYVNGGITRKVEEE